MSNKGVSDDKSEDKKKIEDEEKEKMLNSENEQKKRDDHETIGESGGGIKPVILEIEEGREVKPKKIPIGGIKMPGFFTRTRSKEKCREDDEEDGNENQTENAAANEKLDNNEECRGTLRKGIKLPIAFNKKSKTDINADDETEKITEAAATHKKYLSSIRNPFSTVFSKIRRSTDLEGNLAVAATQAGLASAETLGDFDKTDDGMESIKLDSDKNDEVQKQDLTQKESWFDILIRHRMAVGGFIIFLILVIVIIVVSISGPKYIPNSPPVENGKFVTTITSCGKVQGMLEDGAFAFRGIPYAVPPLDDRRWQKAEPLNNISYCWEDTLIAHNATPTCLQIHSNGTVSGVENCLTLDVVTPFIRYENPIPVVVLIGSESYTGGSPSKLRPSARYARNRDVIFVRPNFRLGVLGFLATQPLTKAAYPPTSGNYGLSDIIEVLKWVQLNIEHFSGDKNSVTLVGHRTGATLVTALATSKMSKGLFSKVWATSGSAKFPGKQLIDSEKENKVFLDIIQCHDIECLRSKNTSQLLDAVPDTWRHVHPDLPLEDEKPNDKHEWLVLDGEILQKHPIDFWKDDKPNVKLMLGTTAHASASEKLFLKHALWTPELVKAHVENSILGKQGLTDEIFQRYNQTYRGLVKIISDIRTVCPLLAFSSQMENSTFYVATITRGENNLADVDTDISAILGRYEAKTPEQRRYVSAIQQLFYHFVWHGTVVPQVANSYNKVLVVDQDILPSPDYPNCDFWISKNIVPLYASID